jgi:Zn-dependent protease with chaperone function
MKEGIQRLTSICMVVAIGLLPAVQAIAQSKSESEQSLSALRQTVEKGYTELFEIAPTMQVNPEEAQQLREAFKRGEDACRNNFRSHSKLYGKQLDAARKELKQGGAKLSQDKRHALHCRIQNLQLLRSEADVLSGHAIPTAYDNLNAKLDLLQNWPEQHRIAQADLSSGQYEKRRWSDVKDIGFREIASGQKDDIKRGQQAVEEMRRTGLLPPSLDNKAVHSYVRAVAQKVARNSDLQIPLHVDIINSREINAFALPGGYLFIERGLLEAADDESELAGVIAHEIAHDTARHSAKLMKRASIAGIFYQAAQIAAIVLTGGVAGIGMYYALQYGFYGLGLVLNLKLLGVSRDYELEADQLGIQYAWKAGYDTSGFIRFFDKIATKKGYVNGVSWFRTHPPFYQRMVEAQREIMFLPKQKETIVQTPEFEQMKKELAPITAAAEKEDANKPSLLISREEGCTPPEKIEYKSGQSVEQICAATPREVNGQTH